MRKKTAWVIKVSPKLDQELPSLQSKYLNLTYAIPFPKVHVLQSLLHITQTLFQYHWTLSCLIEMFLNLILACHYTK